MDLMSLLYFKVYVKIDLTIKIKLYIHIPSKIILNDMY